MKRNPSTQKDQRLYAVGDIHGRADLLARLLFLIENDAALFPDKDKKLVFLGDYVDRGLDSKGVIDRLLGDFSAGLMPVFLRGNHDDMFLSFLKGNLSAAVGWLELGGVATLASYGVNAFSPGGGDKIEKLQKDLSSKVPDAHIAFLENTIHSATFGDYTFVHAGLRPKVSLSRQTNEDKMWMRGDFLFSDYDFGTMVVHGHTIKTEPDVKHNRIGIDTGAFATGTLTCLVMDGAQRDFLTT